MKKILSFLLILAVIFLFFQLYFKTYSPCDAPILYRIGTVDPKFRLTEKEIEGDLESAAEILNKAYSSTLFSFSPDEGDLVVNFVFDERSALNLEIDQQHGNIERESNALQQKINVYERDVLTFEKKLSDYNSRVQRYNSQGGAPPEVFEQMTSEQKVLQSEANVLNKRAEDLNLATKNYNLTINNFNEDINEFNQALSQKPEEGLYDPNTNSITIYFVSDKKELIHTIAHEFGHALGMGHVEDAKSLMHPMSSTFLELTKFDRGELQKVCKEIPAYEYWLNMLFKKYRFATINSLNTEQFRHK